MPGCVEGKKASNFIIHNSELLVFIEEFFECLEVLVVLVEVCLEGEYEQFSYVFSDLRVIAFFQPALHVYLAQDFHGIGVSSIQ